jgi:hypothetical protein
MTHRPAMDAYIDQRVAQAVQSHRLTLNPHKRLSPAQLAKADQIARAEAIRAQADYFRLGLNTPEPLDANGRDLDHEDYGR